VKMWSGRFAEPADADFERWQRSFPYDRRLLPEEIAASKVHAEALAGAGILSKPELALILGGLDRIGEDGIPADDDPGIEDVHHFVESRLVHLVGELGYKLHTGRSRNEQIATDLRLFLRDHIDHLHAQLGDLVTTILDQAGAAGPAVMPAYTHLQRAEPVLVAHWWLAYAEMFFRDADRLQGCRTRLNECPLGAGAVAGANLPLDRAAMARKLGFDRATANSIDATSDRDFAIEFVQSAAALAVHVSRLAEDLILFASNEFGFAHLSDAYCTGSSALPQKKNPDALELLRAHAARIIGNSVTLLACMKGLPLAYDKDLQETQVPLFDTVDRTRAAIRITTGVLGSLEFDSARMREAASRGGINGLSVAARLVKDGLPFRRAHELVGSAVRLALAKGCELEDLTADELRQCGIELPVHELRAQVQLDAVLGLHDVDGGTAPARVAAALAAARERVSRWVGVSRVSA
jgi:argininosuccinate lyase